MGAHLGQIRMGSAQLRPHEGVAMLGIERKGYTELEEWQSMLVVHAYAHFATSQLGPHWAIICSSRITKAADACSTLRRVRVSYGLSLTVLFPRTVFAQCGLHNAKTDLNSPLRYSPEIPVQPVLQTKRDLLHLIGEC
jgi:hypothetical protein